MWFFVNHEGSGFNDDNERRTCNERRTLLSTIRFDLSDKMRSIQEVECGSIWVGSLMFSLKLYNRNSNALMWVPPDFVLLPDHKVVDVAVKSPTITIKSRLCIEISERGFRPRSSDILR